MYLSTRTVRRLKGVQALLDQLQPEAEPRAFVVAGGPEPRNTRDRFPRIV